jgi:hypothetical protein
VVQSELSDAAVVCVPLGGVDVAPQHRAQGVDEYTPPGSWTVRAWPTATEDVAAYRLVAHTEANRRPVPAVIFGTSGNR